jgi:subtilisin-like proprotein convertase family protein
MMANRMRWLGGVVVAASVCLMSGSAQADDLFATLGEPVTEVAHEVDASVKDGVATYVVRRTFHNAGARHDEAVLALRLPPGAAAVGLRIRAQDSWYDGELMEAERAAALYEELTGMGPHTPRDPALLAWSWSDELLLRVFPVPPGGIATIEYTLKAPTSYEQGRYSLWYPQPLPDSRMAQVTMRLSPDAGIRVHIDGRSFPADASIPLSQLAPSPACMAALEQIGSDGSCALSEVEIPAGVTAGVVHLKLALKHTWRGDLRVWLRSPSGAWAMIIENEGGSDNNLTIDRELPLPHGEPVEGVWQLLVSDTLGRDVGVVESWSLSVGKAEHASAQMPQVIPDAPNAGGAEMTMMSVDAPRIDGATGRLGRVISDDKQFSHLQIEIAPKLSELPKDAAVVFVVDASRSMSSDGIAGQLHAVRAYMKHIPDGRAQIITVRRRAAALFPAFVPAAGLDAALDKAQADGLLDDGNGSALDAGAALAATLLKGERGARRVVMFSDLLMRPALAPEAGIDALAKLDRDVVVHLIEPMFNTADPALERDDAQVWAPMATRHGGIFARLEGLGHETPHKALGGVALALVRPLQIDFLSLEGLPELKTPPSIREGQGLGHLGWVKAAPQRVVIRGKLWSTPFSRTIRVSEAASRLAAAYIFSHDEYHGLSREEQLKIAFYGKVVSPVTSYIAIEPGVRPSFAGIDRGRSGRGIGMSGRGVGGGGFAEARVNTKDLLDRVWRACDGDKRRTGPIEITIHTTRQEIVDVVASQAVDPLVSCLVEGIWGLALPGKYSRVERDVLVALW